MDFAETIGGQSVSKGKSHFRGARFNIVKQNERNARRKARARSLERSLRKAKAYDQKDYDGNSSEEE